MARRSQAAGAAMMVSATFCWGLGGAVATTYRSQPIGLLAISSLVQAGILLAAAYGLGLSRARPRLRTIGLLALLDVGLSGSYITALTWAPAGPVAAVHLSAPVLLLGWTVLRRERPAGPREAVVALLLVAGVVATAQAVAASGDGRHPGAGILLSALSAVFYAAFLRVSSRIGRFGVVYTTGLKAALIALLCAPALVIFPLRAVDVGVQTGLLAISIPASLLYWQAVTRTTVSLIGSIALLETIFCALFAWLLFASPLRSLYVLAVALILAAVLLELRHAQRRSSEPAALPSRREPALERAA